MVNPGSSRRTWQSQWFSWVAPGAGVAIIALSAAACEKGKKPDVPSLVGLAVDPIQATFHQDQFKTIYSAEISDSSKTWTVTWSGPNCGTWDKLFESAYVSGAEVRIWSHPPPPPPPPPCAATTNHSDVTVRLEAKSGNVTAVCSYQGSESGTGPACTTKK